MKGFPRSGKFQFQELKLENLNYQWAQFTYFHNYLSKSPAEIKIIASG